MSATSYIVDGWGTGAPERENITQDTPVSVSGGGNAIGYAGTFSATARRRIRGRLRQRGHRQPGYLQSSGRVPKASSNALLAA
jgi:hypothetical protein